MSENYVASSTITIGATPERVWSVITDPDAIREFMFGTDVDTDWIVGGPIRWRGMWKGKPYEDKGVILELVPGKRLVNTHFSPLAGQADVPENYHTLTWTLEERGESTQLTLAQDNNNSPEAAAHSKGMWDSLVQSVKAITERLDT
ncbi:SRPBCC domain-containing protein [Microterricola viridarii]|uniref:ATPase n=1 Tax=Microterricola viridarii TaxID=412690 RepID=A0A120I085_9MICO|nr:SRPBCC domain-containing protein [Microterricola viridarii]AMB58517.1 ATPase [Microterricola viridarii]